MDASTDRGWRLCPQLLHRVYQFCIKYPVDATWEELIPDLKLAFATGSPLLVGWLLVLGDTSLGHLLGKADLAHHQGLLLQLDTDVPIPPAILARGFADVDAWARGWGGTELRLWTPHNPATFGRRFHGFEPHWNVMRRPIPKESSDAIS